MNDKSDANAYVNGMLNPAGGENFYSFPERELSGSSVRQLFPHLVIKSEREGNTNISSVGGPFVGESPFIPYMIGFFPMTTMSVRAYKLVN